MTDRTDPHPGGVSPGGGPAPCVTHGARRAGEPCPRVHPTATAEVTVKKVLTWLALAFVVFYVISAPESSADFVRSAGQALGDAASSLASFFDSLA